MFFEIYLHNISYEMGKVQLSKINIGGRLVESLRHHGAKVDQMSINHFLWSKTISQLSFKYYQISININHLILGLYCEFSDETVWNQQLVSLDEFLSNIFFFIYCELRMQSKTASSVVSKSWAWVRGYALWHYGSIDFSKR